MSVSVSVRVRVRVERDWEKVVSMMVGSRMRKVRSMDVR